MVLWHGRSCEEMRGAILCELANKTTQQLYKVSTPCIDDHHFKEEEMESVGELSQVCSQIVLKCFSWHELEDLIFYCQWSKLPVDCKMDQSLWQTPESIGILYSSHMWKNSIVMWVILQDNAGWDCFKTPILREILNIQNLLLEELCAFLKVIHFSNKFGCVRNKLQCHTVQQNPKSSLWTLDWEWTGFPLSIYGIWLF